MFTVILNRYLDGNGAQSVGEIYGELLEAHSAIGGDENFFDVVSFTVSDNVGASEIERQAMSIPWVKRIPIDDAYALLRTQRVPTEDTLAELAKRLVLEIATSGRGTHEPGSWYREPEDRHLLKCVRHVNTAQQMREGFVPADAEGEIGHLKNALCRIAMATVQNFGFKYVRAIVTQAQVAGVGSLYTLGYIGFTGG